MSLPNFDAASKKLKDALEKKGIKKLPETLEEIKSLYDTHFKNQFDEISLELAIFCHTEEELNAIFAPRLENNGLLNLAYQTHGSQSFFAEFLVDYYVKNFPNIIAEEVDSISRNKQLKQDEIRKLKLLTSKATRNEEVILKIKKLIFESVIDGNIDKLNQLNNLPICHIKNGDLFFQKNDLDQNLIHSAVINTSSEKAPAVIKFLVQVGVNINIKDNNGKTPLHYAAENGNVETVKALLDNGADPLVLDNKRESTLYKCSSRARLDEKYSVCSGLILGAKTKSHNIFFPSPLSAKYLSSEQVSEILNNSRKFDGYISDLNNQHIGDFKAKLSHAFLYELNPAALVRLTAIPEVKAVAQHQAATTNSIFNHEQGLQFNPSLANQEISFSAKHPILKVTKHDETTDRTKSHGDKTFTITQQEVQQLLESHEIYLNPELPVDFFRILISINEYNNFFFADTNKNKILAAISHPDIQAICREALYDPKSYGFTNKEHVQRVISQSPHQLATNIIASQQTYLFVGDGNIIQEKPAQPLYIVSSTGIDFLTCSREVQQYFTADNESEGENKFISREAENSFRSRVRQLAEDRLNVYQYLGISVVSELATGIGEFINQAGFSKDFKVLLQKIYIEELLKLLEEKDYGLKAFFYNAGAAKGAMSEVLEQKEWKFKCPVIIHHKDSHSIAQHAQKRLGPNNKIAINNASDPQVLWGKYGKHFEQPGAGRGGVYAAEEDVSAKSPLVALSHAWFSKAYKNSNIVHDLVLIKDSLDQPTQFLSLLQPILHNNDFSLLLKAIDNESINVNHSFTLSFTQSLKLKERSSFNTRNSISSDSFSFTPLILAFIQDNPQAVKGLIARGATIINQKIEDQDLCFFAITEGYTEVVEVLIDSGIELTDVLLEKAVIIRNVRIVEKLLRKGNFENLATQFMLIVNDLFFEISAKEMSKITPEIEIIRLLLQKNPNLLSTLENPKKILIAIINNDAQALADAFGEKVNSNDLNFLKSFNLPPSVELVLAIVQSKKIPLTQLSKAFMRVYLIQCIKDKNLTETSNLILAGADIDFIDEESGLTPLTLAITYKAEDTAILLIDHGANLSQTFPLLLAIEYSLGQVVEKLLAKGISLNAKGEISTSPLEYVIERSKFYYLEEYENSNTQQKEEDLSLQEIDKNILNQQAKIAELLLKAGADIEAIDSEKYPQHAILFKAIKVAQDLIAALEKKQREIISQKGKEPAETHEANQVSQAKNSSSFWSSFISNIENYTKTSAIKELGINPQTLITDLEKFKNKLNENIRELLQKIGSEKQLLETRGQQVTARADEKQADKEQQVQGGFKIEEANIKEDKFKIITEAYESLTLNDPNSSNKLIDLFYNKFVHAELEALGLLPPPRMQPPAIPILGF